MQNINTGLLNAVNLIQEDTVMNVFDFWFLEVLWYLTCSVQELNLSEAFTEDAFRNCLVFQSQHAISIIAITNKQT